MLPILAIAFILGILLGSGLPALAQLILGTVALGASSLLAGGADELRSRLWVVPLAGLALLAGLAVPPPPLAPLLTRSVVTIEAVVEAETPRMERRDVVVRVLEARGSATVEVPAGTRLRVLGTRERVGARLRINGELVPALAPRNPSPHVAWPESRPTAGVFPSTRERRIERLGIGAFDDALGHARDRTRERLRSTLDPRTAGVAAALVLGDGAMLESGDAADIRAAGLSHVLAVSGTHIAIAGGAFVYFVDRLLRRSRYVLEPHRVAAIAGIPFAILHALFAGAVPSGMRAAATSALAWSLVALGRRPDALETTALATLVLAVAAPNDATRPGFLLSVVATLAVLTAPRPRDASLRESLRVGAALVVRCSIATAPLVVYVFGDVPLASLLANLVLVPLGSIALLPLSLLHAGLAVFVPSAAGVTGCVFEPCSRAFLAGSSAFAAMDDGLCLPPPTVLQGLLLAAMATVALTSATAHARTRLLAGLLALYGAEELRVRNEPRFAPGLEIVTLDVGQGDSHLIRTPDGHHILVDAGPEHPDVGATVLLPYLRARRIGRIDLFVLTHRHPDHYGGLASLARAMPIDELWEPGDERTGPPSRGAAAGLLARIAARGTRIRTAPELCAMAPARFGLSLRVLSPCPSRRPGASENDSSVVMRVTYGSRSFLFVGDAERAAETQLLEGERASLRADVLKIGHHGSRTSTTPRFLEAVRPRLALISAGPGNRFGHPHEETLSTLGEAHVRVLRTDAMGALRITSDGHSLEVETAVAARPRRSAVGAVGEHERGVDRDAGGPGRTR